MDDLVVKKEGTVALEKESLLWYRKFPTIQGYLKGTMNRFESLTAEIIDPFVWRKKTKTKHDSLHERRHYFWLYECVPSTLVFRRPVFVKCFVSFDNIHMEIWINTTSQDDNGEWHLKSAVWSD